MVRPTKTKEWPNTTNAVKISLRENDSVQSYETTSQGKIRTYKRGYEGKTATVIIGEFKETGGYVGVPAGIKIYECDILVSGDISTIPEKNAKVTVIVHDLEKE
jgi:hypothetical protein